MPPNDTTTKQRDLDVPVRHNAVTRKVNGTPDTDLGPASTIIWKGKQYTVSEGHVKTNGRYREGGEFFTYRITPIVPTRGVSLKEVFGSNEFEYHGPCTIPPVQLINNYGGFSVPSSSQSYLDKYGAEAISIVDPSNPNAETGVALGEIIKDKRLPIPAINAWKKRTEVLRAAGSEYLNAVFGWLPLVSDMKDTAQSVMDGNTILENYRAASGTLVHREFEFPRDESSTEEQVGPLTRACFNPDVLAFPDPSGRVPLTRSRKSTTRRWFSGSFTYHADSDNSSFTKCLGIGSDAEKLFGVSLTPDLVWELTPWSWAVDWFSNAQSVVHNVSSFALAGLVMQYGYIMEETSIVDTYSMPATGLLGVTGTVPPVTYEYVVKRRREANPFGFGIGWEGLSPTQLAITAALGITRLR